MKLMRFLVAALSILSSLWVSAQTAQHAEPNDTKNKIDTASPQTDFLRQTRDFNRQLMTAIILVKNVHSRQDMEKLDAQSRREHTLQWEDWEKARIRAMQRGFLQPSKMSDEMRRELKLEETLSSDFFRLASRWMPEMQRNPESDTSLF